MKSCTLGMCLFYPIFERPSARMSQRRRISLHISMQLTIQAELDSLGAWSCSAGSKCPQRFGSISFCDSRSYSVPQRCKNSSRRHWFTRPRSTKPRSTTFTKTYSPHFLLFSPTRSQTMTSPFSFWTATNTPFLLTGPACRAVMLSLTASLVHIH